ncbi:ArsR family transcriptional regulator [Acidiphilium sp. AL]|uniref:ArsR family transcriptional regulator n=1 Tax=Acidiphilium iwatense TaxID=768198 RepID=A0ABS9DXE8_9PROT|nr:MULTISPECIES: helix-turn-helix transcriptional regulator [Acidiphilium]MCF3947419.1 ArsR family transcriptional regulator [Acidiphilium iwatense]MCU4161694.1 ArsR family transcriptional regulator [Acidiphilium sp. AL]
MVLWPNIAAIAALIADPARATMLAALIDGKALPAGELAYAGGVTAQTASSHLARMLDGGLLACETEGRHRYYRLAGPLVAEALESLAAISAIDTIRRKPISREMERLRTARRCYDHLAGRLGVAVAQSLQTKGFIVPAQAKKFEITPGGVSWFGGIGIDVLTLKPTRHGLARQCLDCTERTHHLAGPLGVQMLTRLCATNWLRRSTDSRAILITPKGMTMFRSELGIDASAL